MTLVTRSEMLRMRVQPHIKKASEDVLRRMGLNMTQAMELFLHRVIVDQELPFTVAAMDPGTYEEIMKSMPPEVIQMQPRQRTTRAVGNTTRGRQRSHA